MGEATSGTCGLASPTVQARLDESIAYLRARRLYRKSSSDKPLFWHMTQPFLIADADSGLAGETWVRESLETMQALTDEVPLELVGGPSRFLTYQWLCVRRMLGAGAAGPTMGT